MKVFLATEFHCGIYKNEYYLAPQAYTIFSRYAEGLGKIVLCSRVSYLDSVPFDYKKAEFIEELIPINHLLFTLFGYYKKDMIKKIEECDIVIGRLPSIIAYKASDYAKKCKKKYLAELMCDGWSSYWYHGLAGKIMAPYMTQKMKSVTKNADYAIYVTDKFLQGKYPCKNHSISASNVILKDVEESVLKERLEKTQQKADKSVSLMTTADVDTKTKGQQYVIKAIPKLLEKGIDVKYYLAGGGDRQYLQEVAKESGVEDRVIFLGRLDRKQIDETLDLIDIYIHPSLQEGLPRAVIEAMSHACPCLGAETAGIPELMAPECIFKPKSVDAVVDAVIRILESDLSTYAKSNFEHSKQYRESVLNKRRKELFDIISSDFR